MQSEYTSLLNLDAVIKMVCLS